MDILSGLRNHKRVLRLNSTLTVRMVQNCLILHCFN